MDNGVRTSAGAEKDLTLALARRLRSALQMRLGATVLLTRDSDVALDNEARSAVANNNQANLFISLHVGLLDQQGGLELFHLRHEGRTSATPYRKPQRAITLFLPWYLGLQNSPAGQRRAAGILQEELMKELPDWKFPVRTAPLAVLSSATMPSLLLEIGNLNNSVNAQTLMDAAFQTKLTTRS